VITVAVLLNFALKMIMAKKKAAKKKSVTKPPKKKKTKKKDTGAGTTSNEGKLHSGPPGLEIR